MTPRLRLAVCGGGIGGLSLAVVLAKHCNDVDINVYESKAQFTEIGAGVSIWNRTLAILHSLGLDDEVGRAVGKVPVKKMGPASCYRKSDQETRGIDFKTLVVPYGAMSAHRADMLKILVDALPPPAMFHAHLNKRLISYVAKDSSVFLIFADGTSAEADVLIGADGIKSVVRSTMFAALAEKAKGEEKEELKRFMNANWAGLYVYRSLIPTEKLLEKVPGHRAATDMMVWCGKNKHVISYPISQGRIVNVAPVVTVAGDDRKPYDGPAVIDVPKQEMLDLYKGWEPEVLQLLGCVENVTKWAISHTRGVPTYINGRVALMGDACAENVTKWAISHTRGVPTYINGRVALLGDAAHAMTPHLGAGAGQAIEDAFILGKLLASPLVTTLNLPSVLRIYDAVRRPFANEVVDRAYSVGLLLDFLGLPESIDESRLHDGSKEELDKLGREIEKIREIQFASLPDDDWKEAERMLRELEPRPTAGKL